MELFRLVEWTKTEEDSKGGRRKRNQAHRYASSRLALLCQFGLSQTIESKSPSLPSEVPTTTHFEEEFLARAKRGVQVINGGSARLVPFNELPSIEKRAVLMQIDKLADKDKSMTLDKGRRKRSFFDGIWSVGKGSGDESTTVDPIEEERKKRESAIQMAIGDEPTLFKFEDKKKRETAVQMSVGDQPTLVGLEQFKRKRSAEQDDGVSFDDESSSSSDSDSSSADSTADDEFSKLRKASSIEEKDVAVEGSGETIAENNEMTTVPETTTRRVSIRRLASTIPSVQVVPEGIRTVREAESDVAFDDDAISEETQFEGSGSDYPRNRRQSTETTLGDERPVMETDVNAQKRPDFRPRPSTPRPDLTCAAVECVRGTQCIIENASGRPACRPMTSEPERSCRDINCPRDSRCTMERDPRCRGRDCSEQPVCVREERGATCRNVQCPRGTRCNIVEDPNCRGFRCREVATCTNPCDGVRCPFGTSCRFDGFDALCAPIVINPCLNTRCPSGFECRAVQNQAQCFAINTPAPTTTPSPSTCPGINEEFASCATFCEPNCALKNPACVLACAAPRCQCSSGFFRNQQGVCVPEHQCDFVPTCGINESFNECSTVCEPKCGQPVQIACPAICGPAKCQCKQGFWRHPSGSCVQQNQCFFG